MTWKKNMDGSFPGQMSASAWGRDPREFRMAGLPSSASPAREG